MPEPTPDPAPVTPPAPPQPTPQGDPADKPLGEGGEKALKAERDARKAAEKEAATARKQLDDIKTAQLSELEKAQKQAADAEKAAEQATAEALRFRVAAKHNISDEDAELFLTGTDEAALERQAARLAERASNAPKPDLSQGSKNGANAGSTPEQEFATFLQNQMGK